MLTLLVVSILSADGPLVTVVSDGDDTLARRAAETPELPVVLTVGSLPRAAPEALPPGSETIGLARKAWVSADFPACLKLLDDDELVKRALSQNDRSTAARTLAWRAACKLGARQTDAARRDAAWLAALQLPLPDDVGVMTPEVETTLNAVRREVDAEPRVKVSISSTVKDAVVAIDGRPATCIAPCRMELARGLHVVQVSADGYTPSAVPLTASGDETNVTVSASPADPSLAARQWELRRSSGEPFDGGRSMQLLSIALRSARLLVVGPGETTGTLRGALAIDGVVQARGERDDVQALVRDLLVRGKVFEPSVPLWKRWPFWVAIGAAAVATGVTTGVLLANRPVVTRVELNP
ncbi:MAG: PEGA domain-containing protein [Archangiaceae bacterium]|nr:PEGA domain-containing protein [Archangiaceae bacterium]